MHITKHWYFENFCGHFKAKYQNLKTKRQIRPAIAQTRVSKNIYFH